MPTKPTSTATSPTASAAEDEKSLQESLSLPIILADRIIKSAQEAESSKLECSELGRQVESLSHMLRSLVRLAASSTTLYDRPIRRISSDVAHNLDRALTLVRRCKHSGVLRQVFSITTTADFRKLTTLLESSIGDMKWLLTIFEPDGGVNLSLPPIASNDPILAWVWSYIATIQMGQSRDRVDAAQEIASLARDSDRNKKMIVEERGLVPLLKMLKENGSPEAQMAAASALYNIANDAERVRLIVVALGVRSIVQVLGDSPMRVQVIVANLVSRMAELDSDAQEDLARENVTRPLVSLLAMDTVLDEPKTGGKSSIHSLVQIKKDLVAGVSTHRNLNLPQSSSKLLGGGHSSFSHHSDGGGSGRGGNSRKDREAETPEMKLKLKVSCADALWKLSRGCLPNSRKITETKGLFCLAKIIEKESGELQLNCLMTVMEVAAMAESNADLRRAAFKTNSPAAKAVLDQLLKLIQEESDPALQVPAIKSIGSLARTFPARETRIIGPLVAQLGQRNTDVAIEAAVALKKFVSSDNFNCVEHSKAIIEFDGVPSIMRLLRMSEKAHVHGLELLCYLALHVGDSKSLEQARVLDTLEGAARSVLVHHPEFKELFAKAIHHLNLYQAGAHPHRQSFAP